MFNFLRDKPTSVLLIYSQTPVECVYCHTVIKGETIVIRCPACNTIHHPECWKVGGGCGTFGCKKAPKPKKK